MCFVKKSLNQKLQTAKKDIVVYKKFSHFYGDSFYAFSFYQHFQYEFGECYYEDEFVESVEDSTNTFNLHSGLHSYSTSLIKEKYSPTLNKEILKLHNIVKCIIPQGAKYMIDKENECYISDYLIIGKNPKTKPKRR